MNNNTQGIEKGDCVEIPNEHKLGLVFITYLKRCGVEDIDHTTRLYNYNEVNLVAKKPRKF